MPSDNNKTFSETLTIIKWSFTNRVKTQFRALHSEKENLELAPPGNWPTQKNNPKAVPDWQPFITKQVGGGRSYLWFLTIQANCYNHHFNNSYYS